MSGFFIYVYMMGYVMHSFYIWMTSSFPGSWPNKPISWLKVLLGPRV